MRKTEPESKTSPTIVVELLGAGQVVAERLLDDDPAPGALGPVGEPVLLELPDDVGEELRRDRQVEGVVAAGAARRRRARWIVSWRWSKASSSAKSPATKRMPSAELLPDLLAERRTGVLLDRVVHDLREVLVRPVAPGEPDEANPGGSSPRLARS